MLDFKQAIQSKGTKIFSTKLLEVYIKEDSIVATLYSHRKQHLVMPN
jgi:hypothetical protein